MILKKNLFFLNFFFHLWKYDRIFDRKINDGDFDSFIVKISWGEHLHFNGKGRKTSKLGPSGTNRLSIGFCHKKAKYEIFHRQVYVKDPAE